MKTIYNVRGMMCKHCAERVRKAIEAVPGVEAVTIDLERGTAAVEGEAASDKVMAAVTAVGYGIELA